MIRKVVFCSSLVVAMTVACSSIFAGSEGACCPTTKTVCQRQYVTEMRPVTCTEYTTEQRERTYTVNTRVPKIEERTRMVKSCVAENRTKTVECTVMKNVEETKSVEYTVMVT